MAFLRTKFRLQSKAVLAVLGLFIIILGITACGKKRRIAAKVDNKKIYVYEVENMVKRYVSISKKLNPAYIEPKGMVLTNMRKKFIEGIIDRIIILQRAKAEDISIANEELNAKIDQLKKTNEIIDEISFNNYLTEQGISKEEFSKNIREIMVMEKFREKLFSDIKVDREETEAYYKSHISRYTRETIKAAHILFQAPNQDIPEHELLSLETKIKKAYPELKGEALKQRIEKEKKQILSLAERVAKEARADKNFSRLARKYSQGPRAKAGGDLGEVARGDMVSAFETALFSLKKNEIAGPVKTKFGYHIIKALSSPKKEVRPLASVKEEIKAIILANKRKKKLASLREGIEIEVIWDCMG
jgi:parvulin-like peptidyl-prolyl isomerase